MERGTRSSAGSCRLPLVALVALGLLAACGRPSEGDAAPSAGAQVDPAAAAADRLHAVTGVDWLVEIDPKRGTPHLALPKSAPPAWIHPGETPTAAAARFFDELGDVFVPSKQLAVDRAKASTDERGMTHVKLGSVEDAASNYAVHFAPGGALAFVNGVFAAETPPSSAAPPDPSNATFHFDATGKGVRFFPPVSDPSDVKRVDVSSLPGSDGWFLLAPAEGKMPSVKTVPAGNGGSTPPVHSADGQEWDPRPTGAPGAGAAVDAHEHTLEVIRWYDGSLKWNEFGQPAEGIRVLVHTTNDDGSPWDGAHYTGGDVHVGDGLLTVGGKSLPYSGLSVLAHELTHGVTASTSALGFLGESGAINETVSDIFSIFVQHDLTGDASMRVGADVNADGSADRDMIHPRSGEAPGSGADDQDCRMPTVAPDHASQLYAGKCDSGGVHVNVGIGGNAFALMTIGGANDTSHLAVASPLGWGPSRDLWWFSERFVLMFGMTFSELARWQLASAKTLGLPLAPVACAWVATGVLGPDYVAKTWETRCGP